ncbi:MAG: DUF2262 domain-containing protein [Cyanosarcina radialis HA8281-LM2]|jgi:hypothetical protein|nr:DUF2262 domain-containing protein [Cyanosarcina radialis HA8281-LM2]
MIKFVEYKGLGYFIWDDEYDWWSCEIEIFPGQIVGLSVDPEEPEEIEESVVFELASRTLALIRASEINLRDRAAERLLETHNTSWNRDAPIDRQEFIDRMTLEDITIYANGRANLSYDDGDLFGGHAIVINIDPNGSFENVSLFG